MVTEGSAGHLFPFDTPWAVVNEQEGPTELVVPALEGFECDGHFFGTVYTRRLGRQ